MTNKLSALLPPSSFLPPSGRPQASKTFKPSPESKCFICRPPGEKKEPRREQHAPWICPLLPLISTRHITPPQTLCLQCCKEKKEEKTHRPDCHVSIFQDKETKKDVRINRSCEIHSNAKKGYVHWKLCTECTTSDDGDDVEEDHEDQDDERIEMRRMMAMMLRMIIKIEATLTQRSKSPSC